MRDHITAPGSKKWRIGPMTAPIEVELTWVKIARRGATYFRFTLEVRSRLSYESEWDSEWPIGVSLRNAILLGITGWPYLKTRGESRENVLERVTAVLGKWVGEQLMYQDERLTEH